VNPGMRRLAAVVMPLIACVAPIAAQTGFPPGPARDLVMKTCSACHDLDQVLAAKGTREAWDGALKEMESYGMQVTAEERQLILDYLVAAFPDSP
jgi:cytochrome c5